ncbi:hypothetical protein HPT27_13005 [Permianibacter sp. IMCC34836]|uniref:hypothetical protein n=1 Tax=Permianibacter fluminis TaxID=2738515 RepID=UPI00155591BC|nr:hypothetical protein [Permianibacter fluminis]NQD37943.1 hypothetical protein [Permianibacter fluminis]
MHVMCFAVLALTAAGQAHGLSDPMDAAVEVPPPAVSTSLSSYRAWSEQAVGDWRMANDRVGRIGGWKAYAAEAQNPDTPTAVTIPKGEPNPAAVQPTHPPAHEGIRQ